MHGLCVIEAAELRRKTFVNGSALFSAKPWVLLTSGRDSRRPKFGPSTLLQWPRKCDQPLLLIQKKFHSTNLVMMKRSLWTIQIHYWKRFLVIGSPTTKLRSNPCSTRSGRGGKYERIRLWFGQWGRGRCGTARRVGKEREGPVQGHAATAASRTSPNLLQIGRRSTSNRFFKKLPPHQWCLCHDDVRENTAKRNRSWKKPQLRREKSSNSKRQRGWWREKLRGLSVRWKSFRKLLMHSQQRPSKPSGPQKLSMMQGRGSGTCSIQSSKETAPSQQALYLQPPSPFWSFALIISDIERQGCGQRRVCLIYSITSPVQYRPPRFTKAALYSNVHKAKSMRQLPW